MYSRIVPLANLLSPSDNELAKFARRNGVVPLIDVPPAHVPWLWPGRIPLGRVTLLASDPAMGKSLLALDIAARVSRGVQWPDQCSRHTPCAVTEPDEPRVGEGETDREGDSADASHSVSSSPILPVSPSSVLLLTAEDNIADTVRPRLEALGADCSRIVALTHTRSDDDDEPPRPFAFRRDLGHFTELLHGISDCRLVVIDPITAFLGTASEQSNADVWSLLASLDRLARDHHLAILMVSHFRKRIGAAMFRTLGSLAFIAATRAAWTIVADSTEPNRRLLLPLKNNLAPATKGLAFTIETSPTHAALIRWLPDTVETTAEIALASPRLRGRPDVDGEFALNWLQERLASGPSPSREIRKAADANGITISTLRRVFRKLGGIAFQPKGTLHGPWMWMLPGSDAQKPGDHFCASDQLTQEPAEFEAK